MKGGAVPARLHERLKHEVGRPPQPMLTVYDGDAAERLPMAYDILVIDDDKSFVSVIVMTLERAGFVVTGATDARRGLAMALAEAPRLVVTDIFLPEIDGLEIIRALKQADSPAKIIAISGGGLKGRLDYLNIAQHLGADFVLRKPFSRDELLDAIQFLNAASAEAKR